MIIKLKKEEKTNAPTSNSLAILMQSILKKKNKVDRDREHLWAIGLSTSNTIQYIDLVCLGSINETQAVPMEIFSVAMFRRAIKIVLCHNHTGEDAMPSKADKNVTDRLIQVGKLMGIPIVDHIIITEQAYYSFAESGLLKEINKWYEFVPAYELINLGKLERSMELAKMMKESGYAIPEITKLTGISEKGINR